MASSSSSNIQETKTTSSTKGLTRSNLYIPKDTDEKELKQLKHFSHDHVLNLVQLQSDHINENTNKEDEDEDEDEENDEVVVPEDHYFGKCKMCKEDIYSFHLCYYSCKDCDYTLHKFCAQLPVTQQNHPVHLGHNLTLSDEFQFHNLDSKVSYKADAHGNWVCNVCETTLSNIYNYYCSICFFHMDIVCATMSEQKMNHPSHPHQLQRHCRWMISQCNACGKTQSGTFYRCTTCYWFMIHLDCALLPAKLLIQRTTNESFTHTHLLKLAYSFPFIELVAKFNPRCRVCDHQFLYNKWHYRCDKCRYYVHVGCSTSSSRDAFMSSILMPAGFGKTYKNFKDDDYPNLIPCPFPDESVNVLIHHLINKGELVTKRKIDGEMFCHPHPLILFDTLLNGSVSLHDPMKKVELLCDGCVRPIMDVPFYKCSQDDCDFVLHEWCTRLPSQVQDHHDHPQHKLVLLPKIPEKWLSVFKCEICLLHCNGFAYGCIQCNYYVDINCGFIPDVITHEAHPNHILLRFQASSNKEYCKACKWLILGVGFHCPGCDFYMHSSCALLLPRTIRHKHDKHPLSLRYYPAENHSSEYFCEICENELNPLKWFYHCSACALSMHTACAPLKLQCEKFIVTRYDEPIFKFINVKFGGKIEIKDHPHPLNFVQGINVDGECTLCDEQLQYKIILKCSQCEFAVHYECASWYDESSYQTETDSS